MEKSLKFYEAAYINPNKSFELITIDKLTQVRNDNPILFENEFKHYLFCPECQKPHLSHHNAKTPYLSKHLAYLEKHESGCSKICPPLSNNIYDKYSNDPRNYDTIYRRLQATIERMLLGNKKISNPFIFKDKGKYANEPTKFIATDSDSNAKAIPRKLLTRPFSDNDFDVNKLFYGKVNIRLVLKDNGKYRLEIINPITNRIICAINMSSKVRNYLTNINDNKVIENTLFAFNSVINKNGKYLNSYIDDSRKIVIKK